MATQGWTQQQQQQQQSPPSSGESAMAYVTLQTHSEASSSAADESTSSSHVHGLQPLSVQEASMQAKSITQLIQQAQSSRRPTQPLSSQAQMQAAQLQQALKGLTLSGMPDAQAGTQPRSAIAMGESKAGLGSGMFWPQAQLPASANNVYQLVGQGNLGSSQAGAGGMSSGVASEGVVDLRHLAPSLSSPTLAMINGNGASRGSPVSNSGAANQQPQPQQNAADQLLSQLANASQQAERLRALNQTNSQLMGNQLILGGHSQGGTGNTANLGGSVQLVMDNTDADALALALASTGQLNSLDFGSSNSVSQLLGQSDNTASITPTVTNSNAVANSASLYVKNLSPDADELYLYQKFAPHGALLSCKVKTDPATGKCRGVGFVNYVDQASALRAMQQLHGTRTPEGRQLHITLQAPRAVRAAAAAAAAATTLSTPRSETTLMDPGSGQFLSINGQTLPLSSQTVSLGGQTVTLGSANAVLNGQTVQLANNPQTMQLNGQTMQLNGQTLQLNGQTVQLNGMTGGQTVSLSGGQTVSLNGSMFVTHPQLQFSMRQGM